MRFAVLASALLVSLEAFALSPLEAVSGAKAHVVYVGGYLRDPALAQALLNAVKRGVLVEIHTSAYTYLDQRSYFLGLYLAGAKLYLGKVPRYYLVVDQAPVVWGTRERAWEEIPSEMRTKAEAELQEVKRSASAVLLSPETIARALWQRQQGR